MLTSEDR